MFARRYINFINEVVILFFLLLSCNLRCSDRINKEQKNKDNKIGIVLIDKTIMRVDPLLYSSVITNLNKGEIVVILNRSKEKDKIGNSENYWYNVNFSRSLAGWIYGDNIKIFSADKNSEIKKFLSDFWELELTQLKKKFAGRWSAVEPGGLQEEYLELFDDDKYRSYRAESEVIEGEYAVNLKEGKIIFKNGTYFGNSIAYSASGKGYLLKKWNREREIKFKKESTKNNNAGDDIKKENRSGA